jgi:hypothetical protein
MKPTAFFTSVLTAASFAAVLEAAGIDMDNPHRATGREGDVRVDAQLSVNSVTPGSPIGVVFQIRNLSGSAVAVAERESDASYDQDTRTVTVAVGSEVPPDGNMPRMVLIRPGESRLLRASATPMLNAAAIRQSMGGAPRYVRIKVAIMRDVQPFQALIDRPARERQPLPDHLFEKWFECNETILLNAIPVEFVPARAPGADDRAVRGTF